MRYDDAKVDHAEQTRVCENAECTQPATHDVFWPGETIVMCLLHTRMAVNVATAMRFNLDVRGLEPSGRG